MRITNLIKNYPSITITMIVIFIGISTIIVTSKVYASTGTEKSSTCICLGKNCNTPIYCVNGNCPLKVGQKVTRGCQKNVTNFCGNRNTGRMGCCGPEDCNPRCEDNCGYGCETVTIRYVNPECDKAGNCQYEAV